MQQILASNTQTWRELSRGLAELLELDTILPELDTLFNHLSQ